MALSGKKLAFAIGYAAHENGALAARDAGYSHKTARSKASQLLKEPEIRAHVDKLIAKRHEKLEITGDKILEELAKVAFSDITEYLRDDGTMTNEDFARLTEAQRACISSFKRNPDGSYEIKLYDKLAALTKLGQNKKLFTDVQENKHTFNKMDNVQVQDEHGNVQPLSFDIGKEPDTPVH
jgi:phage terminase small subunit